MINYYYYDYHNNMKMELPVNILVNIFIHLDDMKDMLSFLLTSKHFHRITEKYSLWLQLAQRYKNDPLVHPNYKYLPDLKTFRDAFRANFHHVGLVFVDKFVNVSMLRQSPPLALFNIDKRIAFVESFNGYHFGTECVDGTTLSQHRNNYCVTQDLCRKISLDNIFSKKSDNILCTFKDDNLLSLFLEFIELLEQWFVFDAIYYDFGITIILDNVTIKKGIDINLNIINGQGKIYVERYQDRYN